MLNWAQNVCLMEILLLLLSFSSRSTICEELIDPDFNSNNSTTTFYSTSIYDDDKEKPTNNKYPSQESVPSRSTIFRNTSVPSSPVSENPNINGSGDESDHNSGSNNIKAAKEQGAETSIAIVNHTLTGFGMKEVRHGNSVTDPVETYSEESAAEHTATTGSNNQDWKSTEHSDNKALSDTGNWNFENESFNGTVHHHSLILTTAQTKMSSSRAASDEILNSRLYIVTADASKWSQLLAGPFTVATNALSMAVYIRMYTKRQNIITIMIILSVLNMFALGRCFDNLLVYSFRWSLSSYDWGCRGVNYISAVCQDSSCWLSVLYTVERFISVRWPMKVKVICSRGRVLSTMVVMMLMIVASNSYQIVLRVGPQRPVCIVQKGSEYIFAVLQLIIHSFLGQLFPYAIVAVFNTMIVVQLIKQRAEHMLITSGGNLAKERQNQRSLTMTLLASSSYSIIVSMPIFVSTMISGIVGVPTDNLLDTRQVYDRWANTIISNWVYSGSFFFCILAGKTFRNEFLKMLRCAKLDSLRSSFASTKRSMVSESEGSSVKQRPGWKAAVANVDRLQDLKGAINVAFTKDPNE